MITYSVLSTPPGKGYSLLDSGEGEKLERYGDFVVVRPDPQALWPKRLPEAEWKKADAWFGQGHATANHPLRRDVGDPSLSAQGGSASGGERRGGERAEWQTNGKLPPRWQIEFGGLKFWIKLSAFKHTGIFPEQLSNWEWIRSVILTRPMAGKNLGRQRLDPSAARPQDDKQVRVLNLFGYTGGATLAAAQAGAEVVHLDGSKVAIGWARDNAELSGLKDKPIRWILDDARKFVKRELKRGNKYDGIIMDPPAFGHGPGGELWKIEEHFLELLDVCKQVLSDQPLFFLINGYASGYSAIAYKNNLDELVKAHGGSVEMGELAIQESGSERLLPAGIFARWCAN